MRAPYNRLLVHNCELQVSLGCEASERAIPQMVEVTLEIDFAKMPAACETDDLQATHCYGEISAALIDYCAQKEFNLIESMGAQIYTLLKTRWSIGRLKVTVHKVKTPIASIRGGTSFVCGDWI